MKNSPTCKRNYNKFRLRGLITSMNKMLVSGALTMQERNQIEQMKYRLEHLEIDWEVNNPIAIASYKLTHEPLRRIPCGRS